MAACFNIRQQDYSHIPHRIRFRLWQYLPAVMGMSKAQEETTSVMLFFLMLYMAGILPLQKKSVSIEFSSTVVTTVQNTMLVNRKLTKKNAMNYFQLCSDSGQLLAAIHTGEIDLSCVICSLVLLSVTEPPCETLWLLIVF